MRSPSTLPSPWKSTASSSPAGAVRKMGIKYARFHPNAGEVKNQFINVRSLRDWTNVLGRWYASDAPGVWPSPDAVDEVNADASCEAA